MFKYFRNVFKEEIYGKCYSCSVEREQNQLVSVCDYGRICLSCVELGIKILDKKVDIVVANFSGAERIAYSSNIVICENCIRSHYRKISNPKREIERHIKTTSWGGSNSPLPILPAVQAQKHYQKILDNKPIAEKKRAHSDRWIYDISKCNGCGQDNINVERSLVVDRYFKSDLNYKGDIGREFLKFVLIGTSLAIAICFVYSIFLVGKWLLTDPGANGIGGLLLILGVIIGFFSNPLAEKYTGRDEGAYPGSPIGVSVATVMMILGFIIIF